MRGIITCNDCTDLRIHTTKNSNTTKPANVHEKIEWEIRDENKSEGKGGMQSRDKGAGGAYDKRDSIAESRATCSHAFTSEIS